MSAGFQARQTISFSLREAAGVLGISVTALRRRIAAGQIKAELIRRPQQCVWRVHLDTAESSADAPDAPTDLAASSRLHPTLTGPEQAEAMASYARSVLDPVVRRLAEQEATIRDQAEAIGRLTSELETARLAAEAILTPTASSPPPEASWSEQAEAAEMLVTTTLPPFLGPFVAELSALRQVCERQSAEIAQLREERGWSSADLRTAQARIETLESSGRDWHQWVNTKLLRALSAVAVLVMLLLAILDTSLW